VAEPTVQVPVSLIEHVKALIEKHQPEEWELDAYEHSTDGVGCSHCAEIDSNGSLGDTFPCEPRRDLESVLALLSQSTPSAEAIPAHCANLSPHAAHDYNPDTLRHHAMRHCSGEGTKPPHREDMTPGTTFTADSPDGSGRARFRVLLIKAWNDDRKVGYPFRSFDPSTIRDVTPPKEPTA
jgi:hypothetical protein